MIVKEREKEGFIELDKMTLPKGGDAYKGLGEEFKVNSATGEGIFSIPIYTSPCRNSEPKLSLSYKTSKGNGIFGLGFSMNLPVILRNTNKGLPKYDDTDEFIISSGENLVLKNRQKMEDSTVVETYCCQKEGDFSQIERHRGEGSSYWKITDRNNTTTFFGRMGESRISSEQGDIFAWLVDRVDDEKGNRSLYQYDDRANIKTIYYGNYQKGGEESYSFSVRFQYTEARVDPFCRYDSGFCIDTDVLCTSIRMYHHFEATELVREMMLHYEEEDGVSMLSRVSVEGFCLNGRISQKLPDLELSYTEFHPKKGRFQLLKAEYPLILSDLGENGKFYSFDLQANEVLTPQKEEEDLQGEQRLHFIYDPSLEKVGIPLPIQKELLDEYLPAVKNHKKELVRFLDIFGDGTEHYVRIRDEKVEIWPRLYGGSFGEKVTMQHAPRIGEDFDSTHFYFADLNGSGTPDFIYAKGDQLDIYFNRLGKYFSEPISIFLPETFTSSDRIHFADINGTGCSCLIFCKMGYNTKHYYYDFTNGCKPCMLNKIDSNTGLVREIEYAGSSQNVLQDKGIQLIVEYKDINLVTGHTKKTRYHYRDGFYNIEEKRFCGFGYVEQKESQYVEGVDYIGNVITKKQWFYNGQDYSQEYYNGDNQCFALDDHIIESDNRQEAQKALTGCPLRTEVYSQSIAHPVHVNQSCYLIKQIPLTIQGKKRAHVCNEIQNISYSYDHDPTDALIVHEFCLERDDYGNIIKSGKVYYPRRMGGVRQQNDCIILLTEHRVINVTEGKWHLGIPLESKSYDACAPKHTGYFDFITMREFFIDAVSHVIPYGREFDQINVQARLQKMTRKWYWDDDQKNVLAFGKTGNVILNHHSEEAVFPVSFEALSIISEGEIQTEGGYIQRDGYWWNPGVTYHYYGEESFYLKKEEESSSPYYMSKKLFYDERKLMPVSLVQYVNEQREHTVTCKIDYTSLQYRQITDINDNISQAIYDPFGNVIVSTIYGTIDEKQFGDEDISRYQRHTMEVNINDILSEPKNHLQGMTSYFFYDVLAYQKRKQPISIISLKKTEFGAEGEIQTAISYWDGLGRKCEEKVKNNKSWVVRDRKVYDSRGKEILIYQNFLSDALEYKYTALPIPPVKRYYDFRQREVAVKTPKKGLREMEYGYVDTRIVYSPWGKKQYDWNQCLKESEFYREFYLAYPENPSIEEQDIRAGIVKGLAFEGQYFETVFDSLGNSIADWYSTLEEDKTFYTYDLNSRLIRKTDARLEQTDSFHIKNTYDMQGNLLKEDSSDHGITYRFNHIFGKAAIVIDPKHNYEIYHYDNLGRMTYLNVRGQGVLERFEYGEQLENYKQKNLAGHIYRHYDQAGMEINMEYDLFDRVTERIRYFTKEYKEIVSWEHNVELELESFRERFSYQLLSDAMTYYQAPDGVEHIYHYDALGNLVKVVERDGEQQKALLAEAKYNADGQCERIIYGNRVISVYSYDPIDQSLKNVRSVRNQGKEVLLDFTFSYDASGNTTRVRDNLGHILYNKQQKINPILDYTYNHKNQLIESRGRELKRGKTDLQKMENYTEIYRYDGSGNMTLKMHTGVSGSAITQMEIYKNSNRLKIVDDESVEYDACGNVSRLNQAKEMKWDRNHQLIYAGMSDRKTGYLYREYYRNNYDGQKMRKLTIRNTNNNHYELTEEIYIGNYSVKRVKEGEELQLERSCMRIMAGEVPIAVRYAWNKDDTGRETDDITMTRLHYIMDSRQNDICMEVNEAADIIRLEEYYPFGGTAVYWGEKREEE